MIDGSQSVATIHPTIQSQMITHPLSASTNLAKKRGRPKGRIRSFSLALLAVVGAICPFRLSSQSFERVDPLEFGFAGAASARTDDPRFGFANPASIAPEDRGALFVSAASPAAGFSGVSEGTVLAAQRIGDRLRVGIDAGSFGNGAYRESSASFALSADPDPHISVGLRCSAYNVSIAEYGSTTHPSLDVGLLAEPSDRFRLGASFTNLTRSAPADRPLPQRLTLGACYLPDSTFACSFDITQELGFDIDYRIGISYDPISSLRLRGGLGSGPARLGFGVGYRIRDIMIDYGGLWNNVLGLRHVVGVGLLW